MSWWPWAPAKHAPVEAPVDEMEAIEQLYTSLQALQLRRAQMDAANEDVRARAKEAFQGGQKARAAELLKRIKSTALLDGQMANIEHTIEQMESVATTAQLAGALKQGTQSMQGMMRRVTVEQVEDIQGDLTDVLEDAQELGSALSRPLLVGGAGAVQDDAIAAQLAEWDTAEPEVEEEVELPSVPEKTPEVPPEQEKKIRNPFVENHK